MTPLDSGWNRSKLLGFRFQICFFLALYWENASLPWIGRDKGEGDTKEHTANGNKAMCQAWCYGPGSPWNFLGIKLLSTENTTLVKGAPGFYSCLVHFDGAWIKCASKFLSAQRPSTTMAGFSIYCWKRSQALAQCHTGRGAFGKGHVLWLSFPPRIDKLPFVNFRRSVTGKLCIRKQDLTKIAP